MTAKVLSTTVAFSLALCCHTPRLTLAGASGSTLRGANDRQQATSSSASRLVDELGHFTFQRREAARRELQRLGQRAVPALLTGCQFGRLKVARRADRLLIQMATDNDGVYEKLLWIVYTKAGGHSFARKVLEVDRVQHARIKRRRARVNQLLCAAERAVEKRQHQTALDRAVVADGVLQRPTIDLSPVNDDLRLSLILDALCRAGLQKQVNLRFSNNAKRELVGRRLKQARMHICEGKFRSAHRLVNFCRQFQVSYGQLDDRPELVVADIRKVSWETHRHAVMRLIAPDWSADILRAVDALRIQSRRLEDARARQLIFHSEDLKHVPEIWEKTWELEMPDVATPYRTHGGVI